MIFRGYTTSYEFFWVYFICFSMYILYFTKKIIMISVQLFFLKKWIYNLQLYLIMSHLLNSSIYVRSRPVATSNGSKSEFIRRKHKKLHNLLRVIDNGVYYGRKNACVDSRSHHLL